MKPTNLLARFEMKDFSEADRTFTGLAATWDLDLGGDVIERGAFKKTLREWKSGKRILPLLDSHNRGSVRNVVGKMEDAEETDSGLEAGFSVIEGPDGDEVFRRVKGGFVDGLSIGYSAIRVRYPETEDERQSGIFRFLKEIRLHEVSVCLWPMNPNARIDTATVKAAVSAWVEKAKAGPLDEDDRREIAGLAEQLKALLRETDPGEAAPETVVPILDRIRRIQADRIATRIASIRAGIR